MTTRMTTATMMRRECISDARAIQLLRAKPPPTHRARRYGRHDGCLPSRPPRACAHPPPRCHRPGSPLWRSRPPLAPPPRPSSGPVGGGIVAHVFFAMRFARLRWSGLRTLRSQCVLSRARKTKRAGLSGVILGGAERGTLTLMGAAEPLRAMHRMLKLARRSSTRSSRKLGRRRGRAPPC
ncbi:hypothetical protein BDZ90DRAFT_184433 [Jaminaea rosea]|uniref:Uncharacterized protein n=1 Tax=Jaminaea rosea TaxID=1569628 RepID=A0A316UP36_9BASI|nr:hypothetical protein BDZ90DRAFT_184433 [Jaminaea rosea]PWN27047.1 hypothetical protein BDZ90DRAFT_184433 [Jaminaea rosea]